jgi:hypothetical protein
VAIGILHLFGHPFGLVGGHGMVCFAESVAQSAPDVESAPMCFLLEIGLFHC